LSCPILLFLLSDLAIASPAFHFAVPMTPADFARFLYLPASRLGITHPPPRPPPFSSGDFPFFAFHLYF